MLSLNVKPVLYLPHQVSKQLRGGTITLTLLPMEVIVNKGDISTNMYIVQIGEAEVLTEKHSPPVAILKQGDIFGEVRVIANCSSEVWNDASP